MILHDNSKNIAIILVAIVNCAMCVVDCNIYIFYYRLNFSILLYASVINYNKAINKKVVK